MVEHRIVRLGGGKAKIALRPRQCRSKQCEDNIREGVPGATRCRAHKWEENEACAEHDRLNCKWEHPEVEKTAYAPPKKEGAKKTIRITGLGYTCQRIEVDGLKCFLQAVRVVAKKGLCVACLKELNA